MKQPEVVNVTVNATQAELDDLLAQAKPTFTAEQYALLERVFSTFVYVMLSLQNAKTSIKRFKHMLFGHSTERKRNVFKLTGAGPVGPEDGAEPVAKLAADASASTPEQVGGAQAATTTTPQPAKTPLPGHGPGHER